MIYPYNSLALVLKLIAADRPMWCTAERTRKRRVPPKRRA